jgi:hypothetical protein
MPWYNPLTWFTSDDDDDATLAETDPRANDPANPDATPVYSILGLGSQWTTLDWMTWHKAMTNAYGLTYANTTFVQAWKGGEWYERPAVADSIADTTFSDYMKQAGIWNSINPSGVFGQVGNAVEDIGGGIADTVKTTAKVTTWLIPALVIVAIFIFALPYTAPATKKARKAIK